MKIHSLELQTTLRRCPFPFLFVVSVVAGAWLFSPLKCVAFQASLDQQQIAMGTTTHLILQFEGPGPDKLPVPPEVEGLEISKNPSTGQQTTVRQGRFQQIITFSYAITPQSPGTFVIPSIEVPVQGRVEKSNPLRLIVLRPNEIPVSDRIAFMQLNLGRTNLFLGETGVATISLYLADTVQSVDNFQFNAVDAPGFTIKGVHKSNQEKTTIDGKRFTVATFQMPVVPVKSGRLELGPARCGLTVTVNEQRRPMGLSLFGGGQRKAMTLQTEPVPVLVQPLPTENVPASFNGAVGYYSMNFQAGPTNLVQGDPVTLSITIYGRGNIEAVTLPSQNWPGYKQYPPNAQLNMRDPLQISGNKVFEQVVIPKDASVTEIPAFEFSFFDPNIGEYKTIGHDPIPIHVKPSGRIENEPQVYISKEQRSARPDEPVAALKWNLTGQTPTPLLLSRTWILGVSSIPLLAWLGLLVWNRRGIFIPALQRLQEKQRAKKALSNELRKAHHAAQKGDSTEFFEILHQAIQDHLSRQLGVPTPIAPERILEESDYRRLIPAEQIASLSALIETCNRARFANERHDSESLEKILQETEQTLNALRAPAAQAAGQKT